MSDYSEHARIKNEHQHQLLEWEVVDVTMGGSTYPAEDLIFVQLYNGGGGAPACRWMTADEAEVFAHAILRIAAGHRARLKLSKMDGEKV